MKAEIDPHLHQLRLALKLQKSGRMHEAQIIYVQVLDAKPNHALALHLFGIFLTQVNQAELAVHYLSQSIAIAPDDAMAHNNLANALKAVGQFEASIRSCNHALSLDPHYAIALCSRANAFNELKMHGHALADFDSALSLQPKNADAIAGKARVLLDADRCDEALVVAQQAIAVSPKHSDALVCSAVALISLKRISEAIPYLKAALISEPAHKTAIGWYLNAKLACCDWAGLPEVVSAAITRVTQGTASIPLLTLMACADRPDVHLLAARKRHQWKSDADLVTPSAPTTGQGVKIRVAYISADFRDHPVAYHLVELIELHDRDQFEIFGVSIGPTDQSLIARRLIRAFDTFKYLYDVSDSEVRDYLRQQGIHIVVDLNGLTQFARPGIFREKHAACVVNFLGFPSSVGDTVHDYIIGDPVVTPFDHAHHFSECIVQLPHSYMPIDRHWVHGEVGVSRIEECLPEEGVVFASFNSHHKITPDVFGVWMRLLQRVEGSVLWLQQGSRESSANLRMEACTRGVDGTRLVFAQRASLEKHHARHQLADVFLDTFPYNAHSTACFALRAGLPLVTCRGQGFASRVASSLLMAAELPELVCENLAAYEEKALSLARSSDLIVALKSKLTTAQERVDLFNTPKFVLNLEQAYRQMFENFASGRAPSSFAVPTS